MFVHSVTVLVSVVCTVVLSASLLPFKVNENSENGERSLDSFDALGFLEHYGYLQLPRSRDSDHIQHSETAVTQAVREFQRFTGLKVTGQMDKQTIAKMKRPRCGFPDILSPAVNNSFVSGSGLSRPQSFETLSRQWRKNTITWNLVQMSQKLPHTQQWNTLERALHYWSDVTPLQFRRSAEGQADMEVTFASGGHGDGYRNRFDGPGGVLAHAFQPGEGIGGDTHFDEDEDWTVGTGEGMDMEIVAAHEFGHALGLAHSPVEGALMAPYYRYTPNLRLHADDVQGIQSLYGGRRHTTKSSTTTTTTPPPPTTSSTTTTTTTTSPRRRTTESKATTQRPWSRHCGEHFRVDAVVDAPEDGGKLLFRHDQVYKVDGRGPVAGYPRYITRLFPGAPRRHIDAAVYLPESRTHLLFKGHKVWRFTDFRLEKKYPKVWLTFSQFLRLQRQGDLNLRPLYADYWSLRPSAALSFTYSANVTIIFMFGENGKFWDWDEKTESVVRGYPLQTARYWHGVPAHPDAAASNRHGHFYFFKGPRYFKLRHRLSTAISRPITQDWFGDDCRSASHEPMAYTLQESSHATPTHGDGEEEEEASSNTLSQLSGADSVSADVPVATSNWSPEDVHRERFAPLPFEFDLGEPASGHESERYVPGRH